MRRLHGAMGAIAPTAKKLWGDTPKSPPPEFCYVAVVHIQKVRLKLGMCRYESEKGALISA